MGIRMFNLLASRFSIKSILFLGSVAVVIAMGLGLYVQTQRLSTANAAFSALSDRHEILAEAHNRALERAAQDRKVLVAREAKIASQARELKAARAGLQEALQAAPEWAGTQVPTEVQNALSARSRGPAGPSRVRPAEDSAVDQRP